MKNFRLIALLEGISFLTLLGICMPLKYIAHMPMAVKINGWIHGVLFILYLIFLAQVRAQYKWSNKLSAAAFLAALLPFGTFVLNAKVLKKQV